MKRCPKCRRDHADETLDFCLDEGAARRVVRAAAARRGQKLIGCVVLLLLCLSHGVRTQPPTTARTEPAATNATRPHTRVTQTEVPGFRADLKTLTGARLFVGAKVRTDKRAPLIVHFHGVAWLLESHISQHFSKAVLVTINLGVGSSVYGRPFENAEVFQSLIDEAKQIAEMKSGWSSITLTGFSAGYGAIRAILRHEKNFSLVNNVLLLDGIHASYSAEGMSIADGGSVNSADLDSFVKFAREALTRRKTFVVTHSAIVPGSYASTTECTNYLLEATGIKRQPKADNGPGGMRQLSFAGAGRFHIFGYAGDTAPDHVDHLHAMPYWLRLFRL